MPESRVQQIIRDHAQLKSGRSLFDQHWREIAERVLPRQNDFNQTTVTQGAKRTEKIFDSTAPLALDRAASAIDSLITPNTQQWHGLEPEDDRLREDHEVMVWCEDLTKMMFRMRYRPKANFPSQVHECYISLMAFGSLGLFIEDVVGIGTRYKSIAMSELYFAESHAGIVDLIHREFPMTARNAFQKFGAKTPQKILDAMDKEPFKEFNFVHCVKPNMERKRGRRDYTGMAYSSYYVMLEGEVLIGEGGYRTMPYAISRHVTAPRETYGRSPAMTVLPDIKMVNEMEKTVIRAAHKIVDPPLILYGDGVITAFSTKPNALNYGGVDEQGHQLVHPLKTGANLPIAFEMQEQKRKVINDAFYVTLFQILVDNPRMTATEALIRAQEKGQLLAPTVGRQQSELLGPLVERELDILMAAGAIPPMPAALQEAGASVKVIYTSPLSRLRRAEDGVAIARTIEVLTPIANAGKPEIFDIFNDELGFEIADINGVAQKVLRSRDEMAQRRAQQEQAQQATLDTKNAQVAASAAKNMGQAAQAAGFTQPAEVPQP